MNLKKTVKNILFPLRGLNGKVLLAVLCLMLLTHLVVFIIYSSYEKEAQHTVNHDMVVSQVINLVHTVEATPGIKQKKLVESMDISNISVNIAKKAKYKIHFDNAITLWGIHQAILHIPAPIEFSLLLRKDTWLNISASIVPMSWTMQVLLLFLEIITVAAVLFSLWSINRFTVPLKNFMTAAERLGVDLHTKPLEEYGPSVVRNTAHAMNQMQDRIKDLIRDRTQMLAAISHDLRTPITRMKLRLQIDDDIPNQKKYLTDLDEMEVMISETLAFAKEDRHTEPRSKIDFADFVLTICKEQQETGKTVNYAGPTSGLKFIGRPIALKRALNNLIENAVKYGKQADIKLEQQRSNIILIIQDQGPGLPDTEIKKVFAPFYRGEKSRSRKTGGTGLGLAVSKEIIMAHGGEIKLSNLIPKGLQAKIILPRTRKTS